MIMYSRLELYDAQVKNLEHICDKLLTMNGDAMKAGVPIDIMSSVYDTYSYILKRRMEFKKKYDSEYARAHAFDWGKNKWRP